VACAAATVLLLLVLIAKVRLHPALALAVAALTLGVASGMPLQQVPLSFTAGVGGLMGRIAIVLGLGAILGRLLAASGGAEALGSALVDRCGPRGLPWAFVALGILVGLPVFFEVGLVLLMPIVAAAARRDRRPPILVGMPLLAGLSIVHGTLPRIRRPCWRWPSTTLTWAAPSCGGWPSGCPPPRWLVPCWAGS